MNTLLRAQVLSALIALAALSLNAQTTAEIPAAANASVLRSTPTSDLDESETLVTKRLNDVNTRVSYLRFNVSAYTNAISSIQSATLRLRVNTGAGDTVRVFGLLDAFDATWDSHI